MFSHEWYELLDFGDGRKLERFGDYILDRPSPAADGLPPSSVEPWQAHARYERHSGTDGTWKWTGKPAGKSWNVKHGDSTFRLRATDFGHVGVFPEQAPNWDWIARQVSRSAKMAESQGREPPRVLNLFAYTGGSTFAAAAAGANVVHVDASRSAVTWARRNADVSGMGELPIRWIVEDAAKFVRRELKRGRQYEAIILDPPTYGHGPGGEPWKLSEHLLPLLQDCAALTASRRQFLLLTCHAPGFGAAEAEATLAEAIFGSCSAGTVAKPLTLKTSSGRPLHAGVVGRWPG